MLNQSDIRIRKASLDDVEAIMKVLEAVSHEIPVKVDDDGSRQLLRKIVVECCEQRSWVSLDKADNLVGFLLTKNYDDGLMLSYGAVLPAQRKRCLFHRLLSMAKELKRPLHVTVSHTNKSNMSAILSKEGFAEVWPSSNGVKEAYFRWNPPTAY